MYREQCPYLAFSTKNILKSNPSWHHSTKFLSNFSCTIDKWIIFSSHNEKVLSLLITLHKEYCECEKFTMIWLLYFGLLSFTVFVWLWLNALKKRILNCSSLLLLFYSVLRYCNTSNLKIYFLVLQVKCHKSYKFENL